MTATEVRIEPGVDLFHEGEHADFWWVLVDGAIDLIRHVGREDTVVGTDGCARALGRRFSRLGRARRLPRDRPRRERRPRCSGCRQRRFVTLSNVWFPLGGAPDRGSCTARPAASSRPLGSATRWSPSARFRRASHTRSTTRPQPRPARSSPRGRLPDVALLAQPAGQDDITADAVRGPRRAAARGRAGRRWTSTRWRAPTASRPWRPGSPVTAYSGSGCIAPPLAAAGVDLDWCDRAAAVLDGPALEPGLEWVASTFSVAALLSEVKESTRRISELVSAVRSYSQMDRASMQHDRCDRWPGQHAGDARAQASRGVTVVRDYGDDVPRSTPTPASSTRSGRTSSTTRSMRWADRARCASRPVSRATTW